MLYKKALKNINNTQLKKKQLPDKYEYDSSSSFSVPSNLSTSSSSNESSGSNPSNTKTCRNKLLAYLDLSKSTKNKQLYIEITKIFDPNNKEGILEKINSKNPQFYYLKCFFEVKGKRSLNTEETYKEILKKLKNKNSSSSNSSSSSSYKLGTKRKREEEAPNPNNFKKFNTPELSQHYDGNSSSSFSLNDSCNYYNSSNEDSEESNEDNKPIIVFL